MMPTPGLEHPGLAFVSALYQCRELGAALERFATANTLRTVQRGLPAGPPPNLSNSDAEENVCHGTALVARLVLGEVDTVEHQFTCQPTAEGQEMVGRLKLALFGQDSLQHSFGECVFLASLPQALQALQLVTAALLDLVSPHNCLSLFNVAAASGCAPLCRTALSLALRCFPQAFAHDVNGLMGMQEEHLVQLLASDMLQVENEVEVFQALAAWTDYDGAARKPGFTARLARCVRLNRLAVPDLHFIDGHPLVAGDKEAITLVAHIYLHLAMNVPLESPLGLQTITRRRRCQLPAASGAAQVAAAAAAAAAAPAGQQQPQCGLPEHSGCHASRLEAALCSLASSRQQAGGASNDTEPAAASCSPCLVPEAQLPTPSQAAPGPAAAAAEQPAGGQMRQVGVAKQAGSRRTLFGGTSGSSSGVSSEQQQRSVLAGDGATALQSQAASTVESTHTSLTLEMLLSPSKASMRAMLQAPAANPHPAGWDSRKRLRFE